MKQKDFKTALEKRRTNRPNPLVYLAFNIWCKAVCTRNNVKYKYEYDREEIKDKQVILLSTHSARNEFFYTLNGFHKKGIHIVCGLQNFLKNKYNYCALNLMGVIPKFLFQPDFAGIKKMLTVLKQGRSLALFPEGIQTLSGSMHPINPATTQFLKRAGVTVVLARTEGAYLAFNRYSRDEKHGEIRVTYSILFTPEELAELSDREVYDKMLEKFRYNDFEANKVARVKYIGKKKNIEGLDNLLYICPICNKKHCLSVKDDALVCGECGYSVTLDEYYDFHEKDGRLPLGDIDKWCKWQRRLMHQAVKDESFALCAKGELLVMRTDAWRKPPHNREMIFSGDVKLDADGLHIVSLEGEERFFNIENLYSLTMVTGKYLEFYHKNDYFHLELDIPKTYLIEWMLASEELHNLRDARWNDASNDAYDYEGELI